MARRKLTYEGALKSLSFALYGGLAERGRGRGLEEEKREEREKRERIEEREERREAAKPPYNANERFDGTRTLLRQHPSSHRASDGGSKRQSRKGIT